MARLGLFARTARRFATFDAARQALLIEAALWLLLARVALIAVPFPRLAPYLGAFVAPEDERVIGARSIGTAEQARIAARVGWAVCAAARHVPFTAVCLPQAMAARMMLGRRGVPSVLHFGAAKGRHEPLDAHAWLDAVGVEVTGFPIAHEFTEIACFV